MVLAAAAMLARSRNNSDSQPNESEEFSSVLRPQPVPATPATQTVPAAPAAPVTATVRALLTRTATQGPAPTARSSTAAEPAGRAGLARVVAAALVVGFLTGLFGVGGGFVIVPALVVALRYEMPVAVGTSLVIIAINSLGALAARVGHTPIPWHVVIPFTLAAVAGSLAGKRVADRVPGPALTRAFAVLLIAVAGYVAARAGLSR